MAETMWTVHSALLDHRKTQLRRITPKLQTEPTIAGKRVGLRNPIKLTEDEVQRNHKLIEDLVRSGVIHVVTPTGVEITDDILESIGCINMVPGRVRGIPADFVAYDEVQDPDQLEPPVTDELVPESQPVEAPVETSVPVVPEETMAAPEAPAAPVPEELATQPTVPVTPEKVPEITSPGPAPQNIEESAQAQGKQGKHKRR